MEKREVEILVISDVHLGTYGCHANELVNYLKSIHPKIVVLNGDIIDIWQFKKSYWPDAHMKVVREIMKWVSEGIPVYYLTGNHDEMLRKFADFEMGSLYLQNKLVLEVDGKKMWMFHGDVFDITMQYSKWLAKLGAVGYDLLILINRMVNITLAVFGKEKMSFSKKIKESFKNAVKFMNDFELTAAGIAIDKEYDYVICGHIHQPEIKQITTCEGQVMYLNSGDWVENLTSLEYYNHKWHLFKYRSKDFNEKEPLLEQENLNMKTDIHQLYASMVSAKF